MPITNKLHEPGFNIRPARAADTGFILSLVPRFVAFELPKGRSKRACIAAIRADLERVLHDAPPTDHFFIAETRDGTPAGFLHLQVQRDFFSNTRNCHISDVAVAQEHDGRGIGHALLEHAETWAKKNRCERLTLSVFPGNARARALYEHVGFSDDLLRMAKPL
ncbi:MAG: GNAT family N-acetyltransferase [Rhodanobacteraceae bacterium]